MAKGGKSSFPVFAIKMHYSQVRKQTSQNPLRTGSSSQARSISSSSRSPHRDFTEDRLVFSFRPKAERPTTTVRPELVPRAPPELPPSSENLPEYLIWVKNEPFDFGILSPLPCPKIGINILRKIGEYCRDKVGHYPNLSLNQWHHICKYKLQLATDLCSTYFRVFDVLTRHPSQWTQISGATEVSRDPLPAESWDWKFNRSVRVGIDVNDDFTVNTMQFLLFLYIQHFLRLHKKFVFKSCEDEPWPDLLNRNGGAGAIVPEQQQTEFILANLAEIIEFLMLLHRKKGEEEGKLTRIHIDVVRALSLILGVGITSPNTEYKSLDECLQLTDIRWKVEYNRQSKTLDKKAFVQWIVENVKINPWGPSSIPIPQMTVSASTGIWEDAEVFKQNKMFWNTQSFPKTWYLISGVDKQVLILDKLENMSSVKIHRCNNSIIYLPGVFSNILVQKCAGVKLMLGVSSKVVKFIDCSKMTVSSVGRQFIITDVTKSVFHLMTPSGPIICGSKNHEINIAPYNTSYPGLISHLKMAGISPKLQKWLRPLEISNDGFPRAFQQSNVLPLAPEKFTMLLFPFRIGPIGQSFSLSVPVPLPGTLPTVYHQSVQDSQAKIEQARQAFIDRLQFSEEDTNHIFQITLLRFKKWLRETGHYEHIVGLRSLQKTMEQEHNEPLICSKGHDLSCISKVVKNFFSRDDSSSPSHSSPRRSRAADKTRSPHHGEEEGVNGSQFSNASSLPLLQPRGGSTTHRSHINP